MIAPTSRAPGQGADGSGQRHGQYMKTWPVREDMDQYVKSTPDQRGRQKRSTGNAPHHPLGAAFSKFSQAVAHAMGTATVFALATATILIWAITGPLFQFSDTWQLVINTGTTIVTFLMVFLIQHTQNRDTLALQLKLAELIIAMKRRGEQRRHDRRTSRKNNWRSGKKAVCARGRGGRRTREPTRATGAHLSRLQHRHGAHIADCGYRRIVDDRTKPNPTAIASAESGCRGPRPRRYRRRCHPSLPPHRRHRGRVRRRLQAGRRQSRRTSRDWLSLRRASLRLRCWQVPRPAS